MSSSGRRAARGDVEKDTNCNGIYGVNKSSGVSFEEELCGGSGQRGIIYVGDSVGGHFHAPPAWCDISCTAPADSLLMSEVILF